MTMPTHDSLGDDAVHHLQQLIRIDTTNPPGNETPAAEYLAEVLRKDGVEPILDGADPKRRNVVARVKGDGSLPPLLLFAHLDVVPAERDKWRVDPFAGELKDGYLWGRGAIDMKQMAVMSALVLGRLARDKVPLKRDVIFAGVADEEAGCDLGSKWLVENRPELVKAEFALGEVGGFTVHLNGRAIYPVQVAEKGVVWMKLRAHGQPSHGSLPKEENAVGRIGRAVHRLATTRLPTHRTKIVTRYLASLASTQGFPASLLLPRLFNPRIRDFVLGKLPDRGAAAAIAAALSNTAVPSGLRAGQKINVVPGVAEADVDGRSLPGQTAADLVAEVKALIDDPNVDVEVVREMPPLEQDPESTLWQLIQQVVQQGHPGSTAVPYLVPGFTDAKSWTRLGTKCYGFAPIQFPDDGTRFGDLYHGHDERIPVEGLKWGVRLLEDLIRRFATTA